MSIFGTFGGGNAPTSTTGGGGLFGASTNPNPQPAQQSVFGASTTNPNTGTTGGGLFGSNTNPPASTGGSIFGGGSTATSNQPGTTTGGLFGTSSTPATGASLFSTNPNPLGTTSATTQQNPLLGGANPSAPATGANLFGGSSTTGTGGGIFGGGAGGGLFGGSANAPQQSTTGGGLFGGGAQTGGGLFGAKPATGTGLFGSTTANAPPNPPLGGSLFGQPQQQPQQPQQLGSSLFGQPQQQPQQPQQSQQLGGSLFGQQQTQPQQPQQQSTLFGSTGGTSLFGGARSTLGVPTQPAPGLTTSALGPSANLLASRSAAGTAQALDANSQFVKTAASIEAIYNAWNPASKDCRFQTYFYNLVDPNSSQSFVRPPNVTNDAIWEQANRDNPNPSCLVPVIALGFDDLRQRFDAHAAVTTKHTEKLTEMRSRLTALRTEHSVTNASRILRAAVVQMQLAQRVMRFVQHLHLLIPAIRSSALRPEEEKLRGVLEELEEEMRRGRVKSRLNELWALIGAVGASVERASAGGGGPAGVTSPGEWAVVDEEGLTQIAQILSEQQAGLQHLTRILQKDQKDLAVILGSAANRDAGDDIALPNETDENLNLWGSTSALRASALR